MAAFTHDVFLSHHASDKPVVRALAERLKDASAMINGSSISKTTAIRAIGRSNL